MIFGRLKVTQKLLLMAVGVMAVIGTIVGYTIYAVQAQKSDARVIEVAGRQRMLVQQYLAQVMIVAEGGKADYRNTLRIFDETLQSVVHGGPAVYDLETGAVVTLPRSDLPGIEDRMAAQKELTHRLGAAAEAMLATSPGGARQERLQDLVAVANRLTGAAQSMVSRLSAHSEQKIEAVVRSEIVLSIASALIGLLITLMVARGISQPLRRCVDRAQSIADGHLNLPPLPIDSRDELGQLSHSFNSMMASLRDIAMQTRSATENLHSAVAEILATTQQQASSTKQQAAAVQEITSTVEEIKQSGAQVTEKAKAVSGAAKTIASAGAAGTEAVRAIGTAMNGIHQQAGSVAENVVTLSERTQTIGEIIATVNDIAEQSNLVALNAAIEAADAREDGRRFSVVANEIKNLADQAKDATRQVRSILEEIQRGINTSVMLTEEAVKRVEYGRDKTAVAEDTITKMAQNIQDSANAFQQIVGATNQQQIGIEQVTQALLEIRQAAQQTVGSTSQLNSAAGNLNTLAQQLRRLVEKYRV